jgi:hypothetical protein
MAKLPKPGRSSGLTFLPDEFVYAIAHVAIRSAQLEHMIEFTVSVLTHDQRATSKLLMKTRGTEKIVGLLRAQLLDRFPDQQGEIEALHNKISTARSNRNDIMHLVCGRPDEDGLIPFASLRPHRENKSFYRTATQIEDIAERLFSLVTDLQKWVEQVHEARTAALRDRSELQALRMHLASTSDRDPPSPFGLLGRLPKPSQE